LVLSGGQVGAQIALEGVVIVDGVLALYLFHGLQQVMLPTAFSAQASLIKNRGELATAAEAAPSFMKPRRERVPDLSEL
jgi:hypothetical protein